MISTARHSRAGPRYLRRIGFRLLLGALATTTVAFGLAMVVDPRLGLGVSAEAVVPGGYWAVCRYSRPGAMLVESRSDTLNKRGWGPEQVIGPPDTPTAGDLTTAWASSSPDGQPEWLILDYAKPVVPTEIQIYETYNPGAVVKVCVFSAAGEETVVWQGTDPTPKGSGQGVSKIPAANVSFPTSRVEVYLDSAAVPGWNEIDAVALVDRANHVQWARAVQASSTYASGPIPSPSGKPESLVPSWCSLASLKLHPAAPPVSPPNLLAAAFGWPLLALHGERSLPEVAQNQPWGYRPAGFSIPTGNRNQPPLLPRRPIWTGFLLDTVFFGLVLSVAWWVLTRPRAIVREFMRLRRGQCLRCGYNLLYDFARGCPECGWLRDMNASGRRVE